MFKPFCLCKTILSLLARVVPATDQHSINTEFDANQLVSFFGERNGFLCLCPRFVI